MESPECIKRWCGLLVKKTQLVFLNVLLQWTLHMPHMEPVKEHCFFLEMGHAVSFETTCVSAGCSVVLSQQHYSELKYSRYQPRNSQVSEGQINHIFRRHPSRSNRYTATYQRHIELERNSLIFSLFQKSRWQRTSSNNLNESHRRGIEAALCIAEGHKKNESLSPCLYHWWPLVPKEENRYSKFLQSISLPEHEIQ